MYHSQTKPLLLCGLNTYWHISHMQAKNRNHPHSRQQPLPSLISLFQHIPLLLSPSHPLHNQITLTTPRRIYALCIFYTHTHARMLGKRHTWQWGVTFFCCCCVFFSSCSHIFKRVICYSAVCVSVVTLGCKWELRVEYIIVSPAHIQSSSSKDAHLRGSVAEC